VKEKKIEKLENRLRAQTAKEKADELRRKSKSRTEKVVH
jgi:hypothetical protein